VEKQIEYAEAVAQFGAVAERYCAIVDAAAAVDRNEFLLQLYRFLPVLIDQAIRLPRVEFNDDEEEDPEEETRIRQVRARARMTDEEWGRLYNSLKERLGDWDLYWQVWDPTKDTEAIRGSLADDIADIYRDLKEGICLGKEDQVPNREATFEWRCGFYSHWGKHAIDALRTIHFVLADTLE
jgi:hypothetical protein